MRALAIAFVSVLSLMLTVLAGVRVEKSFAAVGVPDPCQSSATSAGGCIAISPDGSGQTLASVGGTITVTVLEATGHPIANIPAADFWLMDCSTVVPLALCGVSGSSNADFSTDTNGQTNISGSIAGGGRTNGLWVVVQGIVIGCPETCLPIRVRGTDINGDLVVNLADLSMFAGAYPPLTFHTQADFNCDGVVNLVDFGTFAADYLELCQ